MKPLSRRGFLGAALAAAVAPSLVRAENIMRVKPPTILLYGDNVHDDTVALNTLISGKRVWSVAKRAWAQATDNRIVFPAGTYRLSSSMDVWERSEPVSIEAHGAIFNGADLPPETPLLHCHSGHLLRLRGFSTKNAQALLELDGPFVPLTQPASTAARPYDGVTPFHRQEDALGWARAATSSGQ